MEKYTAILLSRQPLRPTSDTTWVRGVVAAVRWLQERRIGVISSVGMQTWELVTAATSDLGLPVKLVLPIPIGLEFDTQREQILYEYDLDPSRTEFLPVSGGDNLMLQRDRVVFELADLLLPVSISKTGSMAERLHQVDLDKHTIDDRFQIPYRQRREPIKVELDPDRLSDEILSTGDDYLIHWTRGVSHPWPSERMIDFYRAVINSDHWPRSGLATLERIIDTQTVLASPRHMPGGVMTISFSALRPCEVIPLMRWRARYGEMSFEPYGIGLTREIAQQIDIHPVNYYRADDKKSIPAELAWLSQSKGKITDWRGEKEYRHLGDLSLEEIPPDAIVLYCRTSVEAERLQHRYPYRVVPFLR
ncbi:MAG: hypothetical protein J7J98_09130 [candidate division Zixibacteria bacterium]|nr:hypothetical protein [candidate division Zixibacteria bacterium]